MAITYDAPNNTITVTGYTEGTPCTFLDIWNADQAGGWGVVSKQGDIQFLFDCKLQIGDGSTTTWFADEGKQVTFTSSASGYKIIQRLYAHFRLGKLIDATTKRTSSGCSIIYTGTGYEFFLAGTTEYIHDLVEFYSCTFYSENVQTYLRLDWGQLRLWNCIFQKNILILQAFYSGSDIYNTFIQDSGNAWFILNDFRGSIDKIVVTDFTGSAVAQPYFVGLTIRNLYARSCTTLFNQRRADPDHSYLINPDSDTWHFSYTSGGTARIYRQYTFNLEVVDKDGNPINGATVTLYDKDDNQVFQVSTAADGTITEQTVSRGYYNQANGDTLQDYGPHKLTVSKSGYMNYVHEGITLDEPVDWRLYLRDALTGNAEATDVLSGKTFYKDDPDAKLTGTLQQATGKGGGGAVAKRKTRVLTLSLDGHLLLNVNRDKPQYIVLT